MEHVVVFYADACSCK